MRRPRLLLIQLALIAVLLLPSLPPAVVRAEEQPLAQQQDPEPPSDLTEPPSTPITVPPLEEQRLPSLAMRLQVAPEDWVRVGDIVTATITLWNQASFPAEETVVTMPLPEAVAPADPADPSFSGDSYRWALNTIPAGGTTVITASLRLTAVPAGEALLLRPEVTARGLSLPIVATGGALVSTLSAEPTTVTSLSESLTKTDDAASTEQTASLDVAAASNRRSERGEVRFTPGQATKLRSRDGRVTVDVPANAFDAPLTLEYLSPAEVLPRLQGRGKKLPPAIAGYRRGLGAFFLEATDDRGRYVHQFNAPLAVSIRLTPQQLEVLDIAPNDLTIFWFDEERVNKDRKGQERKGQWVPLRTQVDLATSTATFTVDHFSGFQLSDGSSPSEAYLPSLQGWQVSGFTGAASFSYPIDVPAGPGGIKPDLGLSYSSAATDGSGGMRKTNQAGWVGKGWSLDTGAVALQKIEVSSGTTVNHYALSFNGQSFDLIRGAALVGSPDPNNPQHWEWRATDESHINVRVVGNGNSTPGSSGAPGRGASDYGTPYARTKWVVWDKSGTKFEFAEDLWWSWANCTSSGAFAYFENNRWLLSSVTDTSGNTINYQYARSNAYHSSCMGQAGTVDFDVWPSEITWAGGRYKVEFASQTRTNDTQFDFPDYTVGGPVRETRQLNAVKVWSKRASTWELVREYRFTYDYSLLSDARRCTLADCPPGSGWGAETGYTKLTLKSIQRVGSDGSTALPAMTFSYNTSGGSAYHALGGWNRLTGMDNGQGGTLSLQYASLPRTIDGDNDGIIDENDDHFINRHRVTTRTLADGQGNSYPFSYAYGTPLVNTIGSALGDGIAGSVHPTSAKLYYNVFLDGDADTDQANWLVHRQWQEFQGHSAVTETDPSGAKTTRRFIQGNANCTPAITARGSHAAITGDSCFQSMVLSELTMGREWAVEQLTSGNAKLRETVHTWKIGPVDYSWAPLSGLWRAFRYEAATDTNSYEGGSTPSTQRTEYFYNSACSATGGIDTYGNLICVVEKDRGTVVRKTIHAYGTNTTDYIVDRNTATSILDGSDRYLAFSARFYDGNNQALGTIGTKGQLTRELKSFTVPLQTSVTNVYLYGQDSTYAYDSWGNPTGVTTYAEPGWVRFTTSWTASTPGNGSAGTTTTTTYDSVFRAFPVAIQNALGHVERADYDYHMGTLIKVDGPNGATNGDSVNCANLITTNSGTPIGADVSCAGYDVFGRMIELVRPGDSAEYPTVRAIYDDTVIPFRYRFDQREQAGSGNSRWTRKYYDGLGREILTKVETDGTAPYRSSATFAVYDGLSRVTQQSLPYDLPESDATAFWAYQNPGSLSGVRWTTTTYDGLGRAASITTADGSVSRHFYSRDTTTGLQLHDSVDPNRHRMQHRYDTLGRLVQVVEVTGNCGQWVYSCGGAFTTAWAAGPTTTYAYTPLDLLDTVADAKNNETDLDYDSLGRKTRTVDPDMGTWYYDYDANGNLVAQSDAAQRVTTFSYDDLDRLTSRVAQGNGTTSFSDAFDSQSTTNWGWSGNQTVSGGVVTNTGTGSNSNANFYRSDGDLTSGDGVFVRFKVNSTDPEAIFAVETGTGTSYRRFGLRAADSKLYAQYTLNGSNYTSTTVLSTLETNVWYRLNIVLDNVAGFRLHVAKEGAPETRGTLQVPISADQRWRFRHWTYSGVVTLDSYHEYFGAKYGYDETSVSNGTGQRTSMSVDTPEVGTFASTVWSYDTRGRVENTSYMVTGFSTARSFGTSYDSADRVVTQSFPAVGNAVAETVTYSYDSAWRQTQVCTSLGGCYAQSAAYKPSGQLDHLTLGNNLIQNWMYDSVNRPVRLQLGDDTSVDQTNDSLSAGAGNRFDRQYSFDGVGNILSLVDKRGGVAQQSYTYDDRDRLTSWTLGSTTQNYGYDTIGNLTSKNNVSQTYGASGNGTGAGPHQVRSVGGSAYSYDANGNLTSGGGRTISWTAWNLPYTVTNGGVTEQYVYNADDARVKKVRAGVSTYYLNGNWEEDSTGAVRKYYTLAGQTVAMREVTGTGSTISYLQSDHLGSVSLTTNNSGVAGTPQEFDPWGKVRSGGITQTDRNFTGQYLDDTGLLFYNARYYDPQIGRFLSADTIVPGNAMGSMDGVAVKPLTVDFHEGGFLSKVNGENKSPFWFQLDNNGRKQAGSPWGPASAQALNRYSYVQNNPLKYVDPSGHDRQSGVKAWYINTANQAVDVMSVIAAILNEYGAGVVITVGASGVVVSGGAEMDAARARLGEGVFNFLYNLMKYLEAYVNVGDFSTSVYVMIGYNVYDYGGDVYIDWNMEYGRCFLKEDCPLGVDSPSAAKQGRYHHTECLIGNPFLGRCYRTSSQIAPIFSRVAEILNNPNYNK